MSDPITQRIPSPLDMIRHYLKSLFALGCQGMCGYWVFSAFYSGDYSISGLIRLFGSMALYWLIEIAYSLENRHWADRYELD